jgi:hypothetical protein
LKLIKPVVNPTLREQLLMRTLFAKPAFVKHEDAVGVLNRTQPVRDNQRGAPG